MPPPGLRAVLPAPSRHVILALARVTPAWRAAALTPPSATATTRATLGPPEGPLVDKSQSFKERVPPPPHSQLPAAESISGDPVTSHVTSHTAGMAPKSIVKALLSGKAAPAAKAKGGGGAKSGAGAGAGAKKKSAASAAKDPPPSRFSPFDAEPSPSEARGGTNSAAGEGHTGGAPFAVNEGRVRELRAGALGGQPVKKRKGAKGEGAEEAPSHGPVVYWMSRDQRSKDNWALLYAVQKSLELGVPVAVVFNLVQDFLGAKARHFGFMLRGLQVVEANLKDLGIPFFMLQGKAEETVPAFAHEVGASLLVTDFSPLRIGRHWREAVVASLDKRCGGEGSGPAVHEVDAHNVVPVWVTSEKLEYAARTIRTKIHRNLPEYLVEYPSIPKERLAAWKPPLRQPQAVDWPGLIAQATKAGPEVPEVQWITPGEDAAMEGLVGPRGFLAIRVKGYGEDRNDPAKGPTSLSGLSPWLHYGQISAQRCALEARKMRSKYAKSVDSFLEETVVRRELSDNFCYYQPNYDSLAGAWDWARTTLEDHRHDKREYVYSREQLELAKTHDDLWNAAQLEMVHYGKMHGFMRMYWAKKILEWTSGPDEALAAAIYLNDKYELDGRDPNGYVGCMWSVCGVHDQGWQERPVFGKIRYMNYAGCKRKFDVDGYVRYVRNMVGKVKKDMSAKGEAGEKGEKAEKGGKVISAADVLMRKKKPVAA